MGRGVDRKYQRRGVSRWESKKETRVLYPYLCRGTLEMDITFGTTSTRVEVRSGVTCDSVDLR